jgi:hypothetical protein
MWRVFGGGSRLCAEHHDLHLPEQCQQLLVACPVQQRLRWQHASFSRTKAPGAGQVQCHLRTAADLADAQLAVPVPLREPARQLLRQCPPQLRQDDWRQGRRHLRRLRVGDIEATRRASADR